MPALIWAAVCAVFTTILTSTRLLQIKDRLQHSTAPVHFLCIRVQRDSIAEIDFTGVAGVISSECIAHEHQQTRSSLMQAPTVSYMQQIADSADVAASVPEGASPDASASIDHLHELYEWIGAVSCGVQGWACLSLYSMSAVASAVAHHLGIYHSSME